MVERVAYEVDSWGAGELVFADGVLVWHELPVEVDVDIDVHLHHPLVVRIRRYFAGARETFRDVQVELDWCTAFQRRVVATARRIPYGETVTYGELAALAGHPNAQRAVGSVCAVNRFPLIVPCHRVVAADGLGSYGSLGLEYKRRLLELEGVLV
jgi:methylated-DNA-[protein]-cysteine S-methyltransferase